MCPLIPTKLKRLSPMPEFDKKPEMRHYDITIVGGGLAGASLAAALTDTPYRVAVVETFEIDSAAQPSYDERTIALTYSAKNIFAKLGVWDATVQAEACALKSIHISNKGHFGMTRLENTDAGTDALGYVIPTRTLGQALMNKLAKAGNIDFYCPYTVDKLDVGEHIAQLTASTDKDNNPLILNAKLIVIADGGRSPLLNSHSFIRDTKNYPQSALLSIVHSSIPHQHKAYERFVENGPLALLPMTGQRFAVVWTLMPERLQIISAMTDGQFLEELQSTFGTRAGFFSQPTPRKAYSLTRSMLQSPYSSRILALGNAAHTVHPVAGQGFNLGLRDVATLAEILIQVSGSDTDIGNTGFLKIYSDKRHTDTRRVEQFTDGLLAIFNHPSPLIQLGRNLGLVAVENLPFVKRALLKRTMGLGRGQPRLARGLNIKAAKVFIDEK
jgi:2-octaprenyl-6-methoxyphenol hydroxylase